MLPLVSFPPAHAANANPCSHLSITDTYWGNINASLDACFKMLDQIAPDEKVYPESYGGAFIDLDGKLNILLVDGYAVKKYGITNGFNAGTIAAKYHISKGFPDISDLYYIHIGENGTAGGDSGGPILVPLGTTPNKTLIGIHIRTPGSCSPDANKYSIASKYVNLRNAFSANLYVD